MSASDVCKNRGLDSLKQLSELSGIPTKTLARWYQDRPQAFDLLIRGAHNRLLIENQVKMREAGLIPA